MKKVLSDERLGAKLRVTENRCVLLILQLMYVYLFIYLFIYLSIFNIDAEILFKRRSMECLYVRSFALQSKTPTKCMAVIASIRAKNKYRFHYHIVSAKLFFS